MGEVGIYDFSVSRCIPWRSHFRPGLRAWTSGDLMGWIPIDHKMAKREHDGKKKTGDLMDSWIAFFESHFLGCLRCGYSGKSFDPAALPDVRKHSADSGRQTRWGLQIVAGNRPKLIGFKLFSSWCIQSLLLGTCWFRCFWLFHVPSLTRRSDATTSRPCSSIFMIQKGFPAFYHNSLSSG
jgi:hypothetical protein